MAEVLFPLHPVPAAKNDKQRRRRSGGWDLAAKRTRKTTSDSVPAITKPVEEVDCPHIVYGIVIDRWLGGMMHTNVVWLIGTVRADSFGLVATSCGGCVAAERGIEKADGEGRTRGRRAGRRRRTRIGVPVDGHGVGNIRRPTVQFST